MAKIKYTKNELKKQKDNLKRFTRYLPTLELKRKVELDIAVAPITPAISISKDSKYIYVIYNGILYQIDANMLKIEKRVKMTTQLLMR